MADTNHGPFWVSPYSNPGPSATDPRARRLGQPLEYVWASNAYGVYSSGPFDRLGRFRTFGWYSIVGLQPNRVAGTPTREQFFSGYYDIQREYVNALDIALRSAPEFDRLADGVETTLAGGRDLWRIWGGQRGGTGDNPEGE